MTELTPEARGDAPGFFLSGRPAFERHPVKLWGSSLSSIRWRKEGKPPSLSVEIETERGVKLAAHVHPARDPNGAAVVLAPGQGYHMDLPLITTKQQERINPTQTARISRFPRHIDAHNLSVKPNN